MSMDQVGLSYKKYSRETRIGACADYLIGKPLLWIELKWGVGGPLVTHWVRKAGFKLRNRARINNHPALDKRRI